MRTRSLTIAAAALLVGFAGGFLAGHRAPGPSMHSPADSGAAAEISGDANRAAARQQPEGPSAGVAPGFSTPALVAPGNLSPAAQDSLRGMAALAASDPVAALVSALQTNNFALRGQMVMVIAGIWARQDPDAAFAYAEKIGNPVIRQLYRTAVVNQWADTAPEKLIGMLDGTAGLRERIAIAQGAFTGLARKDPAAALERAQQIGDGAVRQAALTSTISMWALRDPEAAMAAVEALSDDTLRRGLARTVLQSFARQSPEAALNWAERIEGRRGPLWQAALETVARSQPQKALDLASTLAPGPARSRAIRAALRSMADSDPAAAAAELSRLPEADRSAAQFAIASQWAAQDPEAAFDWTAGLSGPGRRRALSNIAQIMGQRDFQSALALGDQLSGEARQAWLLSAVAGFVSADPRGAAAWLRQSPDQPQFAVMVANAATILARQDPSVAVDVVNLVKDPGDRARLLRNVVRTWGGQDPTAAAQWLSAQPADVASPEIVFDVVQSWSRYDAPAAAQWVSTLATSDLRDSGFAALAEQRFADNAVVGYVNAIESRQQRLRAAENCVRLLLQYEDPDAARAFLNQVHLSAEDRAGLEDTIAGKSRASGRTSPAGRPAGVGGTINGIFQQIDGF